MQFTTVLLSAVLGLTATAVPTADAPVAARQILDTVASVDRFTGSGCTGTVCSIAGSGDLHAGCNVITDACKASVELNYANTGCKVTIWTDTTCSSVYHYANITSYNCYQLGPPIGSISVTDCA